MAIQVFQEHAKKPSFMDRLGRAASAGAEGYLQHLQGQRENEAIEEATGLNLGNIQDPGIRQKLAELGLKGRNEAQEYKSRLMQQQQKTQQNQQILRDLEKKRNLEPGSLESYANDLKLAEQISRPAKEPKKTQASQPIDPDQLEKIESVRVQPGFDELDEVDQYRAMTRAGVSKENAEAEAKLTGEKLKRKQSSFESSYKAQEPFINETTDKYKAFETEMKPRLMQMQHIPAEDLISPTGAVFLEALKIPLGALEDPSSELYQKLSLDLLKGLPETFGNRIMKVEVDNFLKTIPTLLNSADGRRMIASNMLKLGEMKEVYYNEMRKQQTAHLDTEKPFPKDFQQRVFDQVKPQIDRINDEFVKMSEIKHIPKDKIPYFSPSGQVEFVPKEHRQWAEEHGGRRIW